MDEIEPALTSEEWAEGRWSRRDGTIPTLRNDGLELGGTVVSDPDELRAIIALANEQLRRMGKPVVTQDDYDDLQRSAYRLGLDGLPSMGEDLYYIAANIAALLPPQED